MQRIIIGTAGHIDHGKSALVKALTGVNPDRLPEEKEREMTIDLGFVFMPITRDEEVAIIDVPGHERFLRTMIAGASSIRMALFVVAADEGIKSQTIEHFDVLKLMKINKGIIVITKTDKVKPEYLMTVKHQIRKFVKGSFLEQAPIFPVSSLTGQGINELQNAIKSLCQKIEPLPSDGIFRCPIDRIFSMKGFGTVVAGTVISGKIMKSELVEILPLCKILRIRNLQVHNQPVSGVFAGQRAAFNLAGIKTDEISRGSELSIPDYLRPTRLIDAYLMLSPNALKPLRNNERVRIHKGTVEVIGRIIMLEQDRILPGEQGYIQLKLEKPVVGVRGERFIVRSYSPIMVIGGGEFIEIYTTRKGGKFKKAHAQYLRKIKETTGEALVELLIRNISAPVREKKVLMTLTNLPIKKIDAFVDKLLQEKILILLKDNSFIHRDHFAILKKRCLTAIENFIRANPLKVFMNKGVLSKELKVGNSILLEEILSELKKEGKIKIKGDNVGITGLSVKLSAPSKKLADRIEILVRQSGYRPCKLNDICKIISEENMNRIKEIIDYLLKNEVIIEITEKAYLHRDIIMRAKSELIGYLKKNGTIRIVQYKKILQVPRHIARDILDYFLEKGITTRTEGTHRLANKTADKEVRPS